MMNSTAQYFDIKSFEEHGAQFWHLDGPYRTLHHINPARLEFIERYQQLENNSVLDIGCGGGVLAEAMAAKGALVSAIDLSASMIKAANEHLQTQSFNINYRCIDSATCVAQHESYDFITCMEMLEHVRDYSLVLKDIYKLLKPQGLVFFSTINRNFFSGLGAIFIAENILKLMPRGTHRYSWLIRPAELATSLQKVGLQPLASCGMRYLPWRATATLSDDHRINYLLVAQKP